MGDGGVLGMVAALQAQPLVECGRSNEMVTFWQEHALLHLRGCCIGKCGLT